MDLLYCPLFPLAWPSPASFAVVVVAADQLGTLYTAEFHSSLSIFINTRTGLKNKMQHEKQRGRIEIKEERRACWCCACSTKSCPPSFHHHYHLFFFFLESYKLSQKTPKRTDRPALLLRSVRALSSPFCSRPPHLLLYNFCFILLLLLFFFFYVVVILPFRFH